MLYFPEFSTVTSLIVMVLQLGSLVMTNWSLLMISLSFRSQTISGSGVPTMKQVRHKDWGENESKKRCNHCVFDSCFTQTDEIFHVFEWEVAVMCCTFPSMMATASGRPFVTLARSETSNNISLLISTVGWFQWRLIPVNRQKLTFLNNGQFPGRTNTQKKSLDQ